MTDPEQLPIPLERDLFLRKLLNELSGTLEDVVGLEAAAGYISVVGAAMGKHIGRIYKEALGTERLSQEQVAAVLVDLKQRIQGDFYVIEQDDTKIVLGNRACPFGEYVKDRPSLCMMTSNVFGYITSENLGYARVRLDETIAQGHAGCRIVIHLLPQDASDPEAREYFGSDDGDA